MYVLKEFLKQKLVGSMDCNSWAEWYVLALSTSVWWRIRKGKASTELGRDEDGHRKGVDEGGMMASVLMVTKEVKVVTEVKTLEKITLEVLVRVAASVILEVKVVIKVKTVVEVMVFVQLDTA